MAETAEEQPKQDRRDRKEEGRRLKRQRIEKSGGVRPRKPNNKQDVHLAGGKKANAKKQQQTQHRFGQVMDRVPCRNKPRFSTLTIALPGSVLSNCQTRELKTQLVGQIARAATIYHVDEIVVFDDKLSKGRTNNNFRASNESGTDASGDPSCSFLARVLQYCECPQYLRKHFFPRHNDLQFAGLLPPIDAPHHVRAEDRSKYREGAVLSEKGKDGKSLVNVGIRNRPVEIDRELPAGIRCTVELDVKAYGRPGKSMQGKVVSPSAPREHDGTYWGYTTRIASSIHAVFEDSPFEGGYDLKVGTSERGDVSVEDKAFSLPTFQHALMMFGGVAGIEECVDADETSKLPGSESKQLFDLWVNVCPFQGSKTVRTEEAVLISLSKFSPLIAANEASPPEQNARNGSSKPVVGSGSAPVVDFSDGAPSEESSESDSD